MALIDPQSLTSVIASLSGTAVRLVNDCDVLILKYKDAPLQLSSVRAECRTVRAALDHVYWIFERNHDTLVQGLSRPNGAFTQDLDLTVATCTLAFDLLDEQLSQLYETARGDEEYRWHERFRQVWRAERMEYICARLAGVERAILIVLSVLQYKSLDKIEQMLAQKDAKEIIESLRESTASVDGTESEARSKDEQSIITFSLPWENRYNFDRELLQSGPYKRHATSRVYRETVNAMRTRSSILPHSPGLAAGNVLMHKYGADDAEESTQYEEYEAPLEPLAVKPAGIAEAKNEQSDRFNITFAPTRRRPIEQKSAEGLSSSQTVAVRAENPACVCHWFCKHPVILDFVANVNPIQYVKYLDIKLLVLEDESLGQLSPIRKWFVWINVARQAVPGFDRYGFDGEARINQATEAVCGSIWNTRNFKAIDKEHRDRCKHRDVALLWCKISPEGKIKHRIEAWLEQAVALCPFSLLMVIASHSGDKPTPRQDELTDQRREDARNAGVALYIECSFDRQSAIDQAMATVLGYMASARRRHVNQSAHWTERRRSSVRRIGKGV